MSPGSRQTTRFTFLSRSLSSWLAELHAIGAAGCGVTQLHPQLQGGNSRAWVPTGPPPTHLCLGSVHSTAWRGLRRPVAEPSTRFSPLCQAPRQLKAALAALARGWRRCCRGGGAAAARAPAPAMQGASAFLAPPGRPASVPPPRQRPPGGPQAHAAGRVGGIVDRGRCLPPQRLLAARPRAPLCAAPLARGFHSSRPSAPHPPWPLRCAAHFAPARQDAALPRHAALPQGQRVGARCQEGHRCLRLPQGRRGLQVRPRGGVPLCRPAAARWGPAAPCRLAWSWGRSRAKLTRARVPSGRGWRPGRPPDPHDLGGPTRRQVPRHCSPLANRLPPQEV